VLLRSTGGISHSAALSVGAGVALTAFGAARFFDNTRLLNAGLFRVGTGGVAAVLVVGAGIIVGVGVFGGMAVRAAEEEIREEEGRGERS
jgi:hypothetical protein